MEFEKNLKELEELTEKMSGGHLNLKESVESFKRGMKLIKECRRELSEVEQSVKKLISINEETGEIETEDFKVSKES